MVDTGTRQNSETKSTADRIHLLMILHPYLLTRYYVNFCGRNLATSSPPTAMTISHCERNAKSVSENSRGSNLDIETSTMGKTFKRHKTLGCGTLSKMMTPLPPPPPPLPPERADSLVKHREENELKAAPWFQAGIPR